MRLTHLAKGYAVVLVVLLTAIPLHADVPRHISYQGRLTGGGDDMVDLTIRFWNDAVTVEPGDLLFEETHVAVPRSNGLFTMQIGAQTAGGVPDSALAAPEVWLGVSVNGEVELTPRTRIVMVPFAAKSKVAEALVMPDTFEQTLAVKADGAIKMGVGASNPGTIQMCDMRVDVEDADGLLIRNNNEGPEAGARLWLHTYGQGDAYHLFGGPGFYWSLGVDSSDDDRFKISWDNDLGGGSDRLSLGKDGWLAIGASQAAYPLDVRFTDDRQYMGLAAINESTAATAGAQVRLSTAGGGDVRLQMVAPDGNAWCLGRDADDGGKFKISNSEYLGDSGALTIDLDGNVGIGTNTPTERLEVIGSASLAEDDSYLHFGSDTRQMLNLYNDEYGIGVQAGTAYFRAGSHFAWFKGGSHVDDSLDAGPGGVAQMVLHGNGNLGLGTIDPEARLHVVGDGRPLHVQSTAATDIALMTLDAPNMPAGHLVDFAFTSRDSAGYSHQFARIDTVFQDMTDGAEAADLAFRTIRDGATDERLRITSQGRVGIGTTDPASTLDVAGVVRSRSGGFEFPDGTLQATAATGSTDGHSLDAADGDPVDAVFVDDDGRVGIGTDQPTEVLEVAGTVYSTTGGFRFPDGTVQTTAATGSTDGHSLDASDGDPVDALFVDHEGRVGIGTITPATEMDVAGTVTAQAFVGDGSGLTGLPTSSGVWSQTGSDIHYVDGNVGVGTTTPATAFEVVGTGRFTVLEVNGGADLAEPFTVTPAKDAETAEPGMVVVIDPDHPGQLTLAREAYDCKVAGVISGSKDLPPGMVMQAQKHNLANGSHPVALTGRVWCWCDADAGGAIQPGDLLTTSTTPGHSMKVTDNARANGAILGKAMTSLDSGRGLVLILVSLQ